MYAAFEEQRHLIPAGQLIEMRYEDLVAEPFESIRSVYEQLQLGDFEAAKANLQKRLANHKKLSHEQSSDRRRNPNSRSCRDGAAMRNNTVTSSAGIAYWSSSLSIRLGASRLSHTSAFPPGDSINSRRPLRTAPRIE